MSHIFFNPYGPAFECHFARVGYVGYFENIGLLTAVKNSMFFLENRSIFMPNFIEIGVVV